MFTKMVKLFQLLLTTTLKKHNILSLGYDLTLADILRENGSDYSLLFFFVYIINKEKIMGKEIKKIVDEYSGQIDYDIVNEILEDKNVNDFQMNKTTLMNIAEWALNGDSNEEIRKKLDLTPKEWKLLVNICPVLVYAMKSSRAIADTIIAGSLFQTAIGGKRVMKQVPVRVKEYDEKGMVCGERIEIKEIYEELPPNPQLLKFLAEHKLSDKFGENTTNTREDYKKMVESMTPEERALVEMASKEDNLDVTN